MGQIIPFKPKLNMIRQALSTQQSHQIYLPQALVVDDDPDFVELLELSLGQTFKVIPAYNGKSAIKLFKSHCPNIVLTDIYMPKMNGIDLIQELNKYSQIPIIVISGYNLSDEPVTTELLSRSADKVLRKPCTPEEILAAAKNCLEKT